MQLHETLFDQVAEHCADLLEKLELGKLERVANKLGAGELRWRPNGAGKRTFV